MERGFQQRGSKMGTLARLPFSRSHARTRRRATAPRLLMAGSLLVGLRLSSRAAASKATQDASAIMNWLKRLLTPPLIVLAAILMWVEEWLWEWLKVITAWVAKFPLIRWYEQFLQRLPPYPTMF